jgi:hypothetical protein
MPLGKHTKTETGRIRQERSDSLLGNLSEDYPVLRQFNPRMKLGTLKDRLGVDSLDQALKKLER